MVSRRFKSNFNFGGLVAESDPLLATAYCDNGDYSAIADPNDPRRFIIGRTGSGKSAAFKYLVDNHPQKVIQIAPENLSLPYIANLSVVPPLMRLGVHLELFFKALWKHVILVEVLRHRYKINSPEQKITVLNSLKERFIRDPAKARAIAYLDEFGDRFWCETDERVQQIGQSFDKKVKAAAGADVGLGAVDLKASGEGATDEHYESHQELVARYQRIVNETQLPRLNEMITILNNEILDNEQHFTYIVIDDLDKEWVDETLANLLIRCLFEAVIDMQQVQHLKIVVALRTNIFRQLDYGAQTRGGQEEKFRGLALHLGWTENDLRGLLKTRAEAASRYYEVDPPRSLLDVVPNVNKSRGDPVQYILSRTLLRPRDAILFLNDCIRQAAGKDRVSWEMIFRAEKKYSEERLLALRDEWKDPYYDIDKVFDIFRGQPEQFDRPHLTLLLEEVVLLMADAKFRGTPWLTALCEIWAPGSNKSWYTLYGPLTDLLYRISFIGIAPRRDGHMVYSYGDPNVAAPAAGVPESSYFHIHPAFHRGLDLQQAYSSIE